MVDRQLVVQLWNPAAERLFGWTESEVLGQRLPIIPWNQQARFRSMFLAELEGRCLIGEEARRQRKDGTLVEVSVSSAPLWDGQGKVEAFVRIYEDITQRKRTEQALRQAHETLEQRVAERTTELAQSNQRLRQEIAERQQAEAARQESEIRFQAILDNSPAIIFLKDTQGRYLHCNRRFEQVFHVSLSQAVGRTDAEIFTPAQAAAFQANDLKVIQTGLPLQCDEVARHDDGPHTSIVSKFPLFDLNGHVYGIAGIVTDITERKRLEAEVLQISELERQRIGRDLHDGVCQLLTGIRWKSQLLQEELTSSGAGPSRRFARITHLLSQAVEQARAVAHGLQPVESAPDGLMRALRNLAALTRDLFGVRCACRIGRPILVQDHGVATDLFRIAQEAVSNAIKHGKARKVQLALARNAGHLVLKVANDGKSFSDRPRSDGVGLKTMNYRTLRIGATLQIGPGPGTGPHRGTIVRCSLPLSKARSNGEPSR
jgi:PAS domain S-box-containing protein